MKILYGYRARLYFFLLLFFAITMCLITGIVYIYSAGLQEKESEKYFIEKLDGISVQLDSFVETMDTVSAQILASQTLQGMFVKATGGDYKDKNYFELNIDKRKMAQDVLWTFNSPKKLITGVNVFSESSYVGLRNSPDCGKIMEIAAQSKWDVCDKKYYKILGPHVDQWDIWEDKVVISLVRPFIATGYAFRNVGVIEVQQEYSIVEKICGLSGENDSLQICGFLN